MVSDLHLAPGTLARHIGVEAVFLNPIEKAGTGMNRQRRNATHTRTETRIVWRDGTFRVECVGQDSGMKVLVYYGRFMLAQETVDSADMAWQRGTEICRQLSSRDMAAYQRGLA